MIAEINPRGHSFKGVTQYLMHDKRADTSERVAWTATYNLHTRDVEKASRFMAWTDMNRDAIRTDAGGSNAGRKAAAGNVYHYSLSWKPGENVDRAKVEATALESVKRLGLEGHQFYLVAHNDTDHTHVHVVVNLAHPETGRIAKNWKDRDKLDRFANEYELEHGIVCEDRAKKYEALEHDRKKQVYPKKDKARREELGQTVTELFQVSDSGSAFQAALEGEGVTLARGKRRGFVVVDRDGEIYALNRLVQVLGGEGGGRKKGAAVRERLSDVDVQGLEPADDVAARKKSFDRDRAAAVQENAMLDAADEAGKRKAAAEEKMIESIKAQAKREKAAKLRERKRKWAEIDLEVRTKTTESRKKWGIDKLARQLVAARQDRAKLSGFWARVFKRGGIAEADDRVQNLEKQLEERTWRFRGDVEAFGAKRPEWVKRRAMVQEGLVQLDRQLGKEPRTGNSLPVQGKRRSELSPDRYLGR